MELQVTRKKMFDLGWVSVWNRKQERALINSEIGGSS